MRTSLSMSFIFFSVSLPCPDIFRIALDRRSLNDSNAMLFSPQLFLVYSIILHTNDQNLPVYEWNIPIAIKHIYAKSNTPYDKLDGFVPNQWLRAYIWHDFFV